MTVLRKMGFADIIGHEIQLATLRRGLENDRLHHAYLFLGPEGVGKRTVALSLAKAIQCSEKDADFCDRCADCARVRSGNHPDVRVVGPAAGKKEISIQQVRELEKELGFRAFSGQRKIAIVDPASLMNLPAQSALLKTVEEPPGNSLFILISTNAGGLLPTLLSRCLRLAFAPLPVERVAGFLVSQKGMDREDAENLAAVTMGSLGRALSPEVAVFMHRRKEWAEGMGVLKPGDYRAGIALAEKLAGDREESIEFLEWVEGWFRDILVRRVTRESRGVCNLDLIDRIENQAQLYGTERLLFLLSRAIRVRAKIRRNVNRRMALEEFFLCVLGVPST